MRACSPGRRGTGARAGRGPRVAMTRCTAECESRRSVACSTPCCLPSLYRQSTSCPGRPGAEHPKPAPDDPTTSADSPRNAHHRRTDVGVSDYAGSIADHFDQTSGRRQFLAAAAVVALAGCSSRPTPPAGSSPAESSARSSAGSAAGPAATSVAAGTAPTNRPGTPQEILQRSTVPVLCYHQIREQTAGDSAAARPLTGPPSVLQGHLRALTEARIHPVTSTQLVDRLEWGTPLPDKPV